MEEKTIRRINRLGGLALASLGGMSFAKGPESIPIIIIGGTLLIEGVGDIMTGDHHYVGSRALKFLSRGRINITYRGNKYTK